MLSLMMMIVKMCRVGRIIFSEAEIEIISSIKAMKSGKACGKDRVRADMLKTELSRAP